MKEQISEEFACELLTWTYLDNLERIALKSYWEMEGYIKQSREDEIREELKQGYIFYKSDPKSNNISWEGWQKYIELQKELIDLLDKKIRV